MGAKAKRARNKSRRTAAVSNSHRSKAVWGAFALSMSTVGGLLWLLQGGAAAQMQGLSLPPMVAAAGSSSIDGIFKTRQMLTPARWQAIVIHHSGSPVGSPGTIDAQHKAQGLDGLGFHFVIGNGSGFRDGEIQVGYRWLDQFPGAHVGGPGGDWYNHHAIGICLVGDGSRRPFTDQQASRLVDLVSALARKLEIPPERIYLHSELAATESPGRFFPEAAFREQLARMR
jgi:hypothetical protein